MVNPKYALFALGWESKLVPPSDLTAWAANLKLDAVEVLYVYGLGDGTVYDHLLPWLQGNGERQLVILEEDSGIIATALQSSAPLLYDSQVTLEWLDQGLPELYPVSGIDVLALPGKETAKFRSLRLQLLRKTALSHSLFVDRFHGYQIFDNFINNIPQLQNAFYANGLKGAFATIPAIICGAGPSLNQAIETLRKLEGRALVIAGGSAITALSRAGIEPHFAIAIDPNAEEFRRLQNSFAFECPFLFSTRLCSSVFQTCNGPFGYLRCGSGGPSELWLDEELGLTDPLVGEHLSDESISVTAIALAFAQHIGCSSIILSGMDLAYTDGKRYAIGVSDEKVQLDQSGPDRILRKKDKRGKYVNTAVRWVMEAASISHYAKKHPEIRWINTTEGGLSIKGIEQMGLETVATDLLIRRWDLRELIAQQIALHPMPSVNKDFRSLLTESLLKVIAHLEVLAGERSGSNALAELEMEGEVAFSVLFYDMDKVLLQALSRKIRGDEDSRARWILFLEIARKYALIATTI